jgi:hypothetical protein
MDVVAVLADPALDEGQLVGIVFQNRDAHGFAPAFCRF